MSVLDKTTNAPFSGMPSSAYNTPLRLTGYNGYSIPISFIPSVRGELFEMPQYTESVPPEPVYSYDVSLSTAENPLGQHPKVSLSLEDKAFFEGLLRQPGTDLIDRVSSQHELIKGSGIIPATYSSVPVPAIIDSIETLKSEQNQKIITPAEPYASAISEIPLPPPMPYKITTTEEATSAMLEPPADFVEELKGKLKSGGVKLKPASERKLAPKKPRAEGTKIVNPITGRKVLASGKIGMKIIAGLPEPSVDIVPVPKKEKEEKESIEEIASRRLGQ